MNFKILIKIIFLFICSYTYSQNDQGSIVWVRINNEQAKPKELKSTNHVTNNDSLNRIFEKDQVIYYKQALPFAKNPKLLEIYEIKLKGNPEEFKKHINMDCPNMFKEINIQQQPIATYEPSDYMWQAHSYDWLWYLRRIEAEKAWDITHGNNDVTIAIIDTKFDLLHPDLANKFIVNYDPYTGILHQGLLPGESSHGTLVASLAVAHTDGGGQLASIGFNTRFYGYTWDNGLTKALHASNVMHADIISISWFGSCSPNSDDALIIHEILDNGTIICASAGNGLQHCNGGEIYPFGTGNDTRIIKVSTTGINDNHQVFKTDGTETTDSHYPGVDICAPAENVMMAMPSVGSEWPYYGGDGATSGATPIIAGVCALMLSVNPCLTPEGVETILRNTADPIIDEYLYPGMLGGGRVNAYKAVKAAGTREISNTTLTGNQNLSAGYGFVMTNVIIGNAANINLDARIEVIINGEFAVPLGSTFSIDMSSDVQNNCGL